MLLTSRSSHDKTVLLRHGAVKYRVARYVAIFRGEGHNVTWSNKIEAFGWKVE
jgi:hypothetical protein